MLHSRCVSTNDQMMQPNVISPIFKRIYDRRRIRVRKLDDSVVRLFFDVLHGIDRADIPLVVALEFAILLGYDGQLKQNSDLEKELFQCTIEQLNKTKMTKVENALMWLYVKTWGLQGQHVIEQDQMWNFGGEDLEEAIIGEGLNWGCIY